MKFGNTYNGEVILNLHHLSAEDIGIELLISEIDTEGNVRIIDKQDWGFDHYDQGLSHYTIEFAPSKAGNFNYGIRMFAKNPELPHKQDFNYVRWL